jgi:Tfp pilus assembly protein PilX
MRCKGYITNNRRGSALIIGLLTLAVLSLIGTISTTTSSIEVQIAGNEKTYQEAFYASELGLSVGEMVVERLLAREEFDETNTVGHYGAKKQPKWKDLTWDNNDSISIAVDEIPYDFAQIIADLPRYVVEERRFIPDSLVVGYGAPTGIYQFNVTATGTGGVLTSQAVLQTIYAKRYN